MVDLSLPSSADQHAAAAAFISSAARPLPDADVWCILYPSLRHFLKSDVATIDEKSLLQAVDTAVQMNLDGDYGVPVPDYVEENVSTKVVKIIQSYTGVVDKMVWRK